MGAAKRRGTYEQRKAQKLAKQFGMTNAEIAEAYKMNLMFNLRPIIHSPQYQALQCIINMFR